PTPEGERDGYVFTPVNTVVNAFHYRSLVLIGRIANVLGRVQEAERFFKRAEMVKIAFNKQFLNRTTGIYVDGIGTEHSSLHANMFPLAFGLVPDNNLSRVVAFIKSRGMACSVYGAQYLLEALFAAGETEYALQLMTSESKRSWMNMIRAGSTMTTEAWDEYFKPNLTWNHAWGSAPANIIARKLMGIEPLKPAYRTIRVKPQLGNLRYAHIKKPTIRGMVEVTWQRDEDDFILIVHIPANTEAEIWIPSAPQSVIAESGTDIYQAKDIEIVDKKDKFTICRTGAGEYHFTGKMF
ncbi:MAG: alpha-L-rhamnosidase, partial [Calditrichales bacterium]